MRSAQNQRIEQTKNVLLADSTEQNSARIQTLLQPHSQYRLLTCATYTEALTQLHNNKVDILIFSCNCSSQPCANIITDLYHNDPSVPIIALSDDIDEYQGQALLDAQATDYLSTVLLNEESLLRSLRYAERYSKLTNEIRCLRNSDMLTLASNRQSFYQLLESKLNKTHSETEKRQLALISVDLDDFKQFNRHYGFNAGDKVIQVMSKRIQNMSQPSGLIARFGSDEFAILLDLAPESDIQGTVKKYLSMLIARLNTPYPNNNQSTRIHCSIGVSVAPIHDCNVDQLIHQATQARLNAKQVHGCSYSFFRPAMDQTIEKFQGLSADMAKALSLNQFELYYQPRINLASGRIIGAETLIRWNHPVHGLIMPGDFIPISERNGMIGSIGYWVLYQAGKHLKKLRNEGLPIERLGINLSFHQFKDEMLVDIIKRIVTQEEIDSSVLEFELTESAVFRDEEHIAECLDALAKEGITFSLDDFGTGYSSLSRLHKLPISALKIDRSFISHVNESSEAAVIVRSILLLAQGMKIKVIAEGVETQQQLDFLLEHKCDEIQGFLFSPPVPFTDFKRMLSNPEKVANSRN
ncbi:MAG: hypothetical protein CSA61_02355 [Neptuniibacter caesariensis]|uniref:GGDEF-domain containing protein n=1 Tax=Neptuniibacter caesariensis TaxID=207954 RepID=A0A2G6JAG5_NEPCE|nr:MAG: hypothetical protein CSA61_02355 [Neptuniibacter caesariensis]